MHAMPLLLGVLALMAIAYRYYSAFLATRVAVLDASRATPSHRLNDGQNYHPTNRWILFGHHFAAISGAGPLIGPVLAIQFGYMPGLIWLVIGVCLAGAVQDFLVLAASVRHDGKSLAQIAREMMGPKLGMLISIAILFIVIIALAGLGVVVVKALGGERVPMAPGSVIAYPGELIRTPVAKNVERIEVARGASVLFPSGVSVRRSEPFTIEIPSEGSSAQGSSAQGASDNTLTIPPKSMEVVRGSSWGTFTIACTIPIALLVGLYMYRFRKGRVVEASILGAAGVLLATFLGSWVPGSWAEPYFLFSRDGTILAICLYGFIASVLPVWLLLCPRDYLSSFLKIGTIIVLMLGIVLANPKLNAPAVNEHFAWGGGPYFVGGIFPFVFICIMCGAVSGFHALVSSGTTPKMASSETDLRMIGYGSMLMEGMVAVCALIAAAAMPEGDYWAINIDLSKVEKYADTLTKMHADIDHLDRIEAQVGGETLRGRTGGAVTLAVGMAQIMSEATAKVTSAVSLDGLIKYWFHFAIMFEALFILTTIDTGTRIARFLLQEVLGNAFPKFRRMDWWPGVWLTSALVTLGWGSLIWTGSIQTIWPMFGIANQLLAGMALCIVTTWLFRQGRGRYAWVTILPMGFIVVTTFTAGAQLIHSTLWPDLVQGIRTNAMASILKGGLSSAAIMFLITAFSLLLGCSIHEWLQTAPSDSRQSG
ncbi:MAG: carbon starvation protein A [Planctomycetota bacterium]|jgi:carbon starvation protein